MKMKLLILLLVVVMVFVFGTAVFATDVSLGGTLYFRLEGNTDAGIDDQSMVDFFRINVSTRKYFGKGQAYLEIQTQTWIPDRDQENKFWNIYNYGYDYNFSNLLGAGIMYHTEGVTLGDGELGSNWDWLNVRAFEKKHVLKVIGRPLTGLNAGLYLEPAGTEYIIKGEYRAPRLRVGGGFSNSGNLVGLNQDGIDHYYNVYAEVNVMDGVRVYGDYLADGKFLVDAGLTFDRVTVVVLYSNEDKYQFNQEVFAAETADISVDYALSRETSVTGGAVYDTAGAELAAVYGKYNFHPGYVGVKHDLGLSETHISGGYTIDGVNTLKGSYNIATGAWWIAMAVGLW